MQDRVSFRGVADQLVYFSRAIYGRIHFHVFPIAQRKSQLAEFSYAMGLARGYYIVVGSRLLLISGNVGNVGECGDSHHIFRVYFQ